LPATKAARQTVGLIYAESATLEVGGGENFGEKVAIGQTAWNRTAYATIHPSPPCFNGSFGNGSLWSAVTAPGQFASYQSPRWNDVMTGDDLKPLPALDASLRGFSRRFHFNQSVDAVLDVVQGLGVVPELSDGKPVAFWRADLGTDPKNPRYEFRGTLGAHHFFVFAPGQECQ
jgi:hypothetical protein